MFFDRSACAVSISSARGGRCRTWRHAQVILSVSFAEHSSRIREAKTRDAGELQRGLDALIAAMLGRRVSGFLFSIASPRRTLASTSAVRLSYVVSTRSMRMSAWLNSTALRLCLRTSTNTSASARMNLHTRSLPGISGIN